MTRVSIPTTVLVAALLLILAGLTVNEVNAQAPTAQDKSCREVQFENPCKKRAGICKWLPKTLKCVDFGPTESPVEARTQNPTNELKPCEEYFQKWACREHREDGACFWIGLKDTGYCVARSKAPTVFGQTTKKPTAFPTHIQTPSPTKKPNNKPTKRPVVPPPSKSPTPPPAPKACELFINVECPLSRCKLINNKCTFIPPTPVPTFTPTTSIPTSAPTKKHPPCSNFKTLLRCCGSNYTKTRVCKNAKVPNPGCIWRAKTKTCASVVTLSPTGGVPTTSRPTTGRPTSKSPTTKGQTPQPTNIEY